MESCTPVHKDFIERLFIYSDGSHDPDTYTIWLDGTDKLVARNTGESAQALFARVLEEIRHKRYLGRRAKPPMRRNAFAYIFAGITPTNADIAEMERREYRLALMTMANSGETPDERIFALSILTDMPSQKSVVARTE